MIIKTKSMFLPIKYSVPTILIRIELLELELEIKCLELKIEISEAVARRCPVENVFLR